MENILIDELPRTVEINGKEYPINWGYRAMILCEIDLFTNKSDDEKIDEILNIFYLDNVPDDTDQASSKFLEFYTRSERKKEKAESQKRAPINSKRVYCFEQDAPFIYAAFRTQYGINLNNTKNKDLHWWEFMAMFDSLDENLLFSKIMYWRGVNINSLSKAEKKFIRRMKKIYALKSEEVESNAKMKLAKRNADMLAYVRMRFNECRKK